LNEDELSATIACQSFIDEWLNQALLTVEEIRVLTGCWQDAAGLWFLPNSPDDPRIPGGPVLTVDESGRTAPLQRQLELEIYGLWTWWGQYPPYFGYGAPTLAEDIGALYDESLLPGTGRVRTDAWFFEYETYWVFIEPYVTSGNATNLSPYIAWWGQRRQAAATKAVTGLPGPLQAIGWQTLGGDRPPLPWDLADPVTVAEYLDWALANGRVPATE